MPLTHETVVTEPATKPLDEESLKETFFEGGEPKLWTLWYMYGSSDPHSKMFLFPGNMQQASLRGRKHCEIMHYRFVRVRPALVDLDYQENQLMKGKYRDPDSRDSM